MYNPTRSDSVCWQKYKSQQQLATKKKLISRDMQSAVHQCKQFSLLVPR